MLQVKTQTADKSYKVRVRGKCFLQIGTMPFLTFLHTNELTGLGLVWPPQKEVDYRCTLLFEGKKRGHQGLVAVGETSPQLA